MKNNKGFTMIELLAVVTIMGILAVIAIPAVTKYITKGQNQAYETMKKSTYIAAENYMMDNPGMLEVNETTSVTASKLVQLDYLEYLVDPASKNSAKRCDEYPESKVVIERKYNGPDGLPDYTYTVYLKCPSFSTVKNEVYPK